MTQPPAPAPFGPGSRAAHYSILEPLGKGGMGEVFLAHDTRLDRNVAIKVLPQQFASDARRLRRFEMEAKALAALNHPNIVSVFAIEEALGRHLLVMELVHGRTLRELIRPGGMTAEEFLEIALSLSDALAAAHAGGVMHRDLKPENVMLTSSGRVKVLDFGLAKFRSSAPESSSDETTVEWNLTMEGVALGTVPYMSPEQADGDPVDARSDVFSIGTLFHEMLTGELPFRGRTIAQTVSAILRDDPPPLERSRADLLPGFARILRQCLRKSREERFASGSELHSALKQLQREVTRSSVPAASIPVQAWSTPSPAAEVTWSTDPPLPVASTLWRLLDSRWGLTGVLVLLWSVNWIQTNAEDLWSVRRGAWLGYDIAAAFTWFEQGLSFDHHDLSGPVAVYLGSVAYFFLPVVLLAMTLVTLLSRRTVDGYRIFIFAIVTCYALSLPFYLFLPIPERWAYPDSQAILLSDLWSARLIETIRPISGIDNCFPSFHVSGTMALVAVWYVLRLNYRHTIFWLGAAVSLSTVILGIHWIADVVAGLALAVISTRLAVRMNETFRQRS